MEEREIESNVVNLVKEKWIQFELSFIEMNQTSSHNFCKEVLTIKST